MISFVSAASAQANTLTLPPHQAGDMIIMFAYVKGSTTFPTLPAGWFNISASGSTSTTSNRARRVAYKFATSSNESADIWTGATSVICAVYRGCQNRIGAWPIYNFDGKFYTATTITYTGLGTKFINNSGSSRVVTFLGHSGTDITPTPLTGFVTRNVLDGSTQTLAVFDSGQGINQMETSVAAGGVNNSNAIFTLELYDENTFPIVDFNATSWVSPNFGATVSVEAWGGGGGGGALHGGTTLSDPAGYGGQGGHGGGGGAYARKKFIPIKPNTAYDINVGNGGTGGNHNLNVGSAGAAGEDTWFISPSVLLAKGGGGGGIYSGSIGLGGSAAASVGDIKYSGGNGGAGHTTTGGGGGGGGAGYAANGGTGGSAASNTQGTAGVSGGGFGGTGGTGGNAGFHSSDGSITGGGGGGAGYPTSIASGARGGLVIVVNPTNNNFLNFM